MTAPVADPHAEAPARTESPTDHPHAGGHGNAPGPDRLARFSHELGNLVPDATSASVLLLAIVVVTAVAIGNGASEVMDAYYRGLWMLLPFTMQMTLILVLSAVVGSAPLFRRAILALADMPRTVSQVVGLAVGVGAAVSYVYWGLGVAMTPIIAIHFSAAAERKGLKVDFPFLLAAIWAAGAVWQFGPSSSPALLMATPGHFLEAEVGLLPLATTIWALPSVLLVLTFPVAVWLLTIAWMPRHPRGVSAFPGAYALTTTAEPAPPATAPEDRPAGFAAWVERSPIVPGIMALVFLGWLHHHFVTKSLSLDLNAMNTMLLTLALLMHRNVAGFSRALQTSVQVCWPVLVLYHFYGGVAGLLQYTTVGAWFAAIFAAVSTPLTFPLFTAIGSTIIAVFVPSSGGQWVVQGYVTSQTAQALGATPQLGLLSVGVGDHMGNLLSPFWPVLIAGIARIDFRTFFGYGVVFAALWFVMGVGIFTFVR
jgi:short-chain fatty acids transporter